VVMGGDVVVGGWKEAEEGKEDLERLDLDD